MKKSCPNTSLIRNNRSMPMLSLEYVVHIRALTRYLRGEPTGIVALLLEHFLYPIANMHHTSTVYFNHINLEYKYSKPQGFDHPRGLPKREYA